MDHPITTFRADHGLTLGGFAAMVGVKRAAVWKWENGTPPSPSSAVEIEKATSGAVRRWQLRPDLWPNPADAEAA